MPGPRPTASPSEPNRKPVTEEEVMELLRQAGAPDPPAWLGALTDLTGIVNVVAELRGGVPASPEVKLRRRAQRAINELRLLPPQLVLWSHHHENNPSLLTSPGTPEEAAAHRQRYANQAAAEIALHRALIDLAPPSRHARRLPLDASAPAHWHMPAALLWLGYRALIGKGSTSRNGPANKFVRLALKRAGYRKLGAEAVEQALNRSPMTTNCS